MFMHEIANVNQFLYHETTFLFCNLFNLFCFLGISQFVKFQVEDKRDETPIKVYLDFEVSTSTPVNV